MRSFTATRSVFAPTPMALGRYTQTSFHRRREIYLQRCETTLGENWPACRKKSKNTGPTMPDMVDHATSRSKSRSLVAQQPNGVEQPQPGESAANRKGFTIDVMPQPGAAGFPPPTRVVSPFRLTFPGRRRHRENPDFGYGVIHHFEVLRFVAEFRRSRERRHPSRSRDTYRSAAHC